MIIKSIEIENFKNIQNRHLDFDDSRFNLPARNGWGKSNTVDAILWVFTDRLKNGSADIQSIKAKPLPNDPNPSNKSKVARVKIITDVGTFEKRYNEVWKKPRGGTKEVLDGHETTYIIDGVEYKKSIYETELALRCKVPTALMPILMVADYFGVNVDYKDRRKVILPLLDDITFDDVVEDNPTLLRLKPLFDIEPRLEVVLKKNAQELKNYRNEEQQIIGKINAYKQALISPEEFKLKDEFIKEQSDVNKQLAQMEYQFKQGSTSNTDEIKKQLAETIINYKTFDKIKTAEVKKVVCQACGYNHIVEDELAKLIKQGHHLRELQNGAVQHKNELSQEEKETYNKLKMRSNELDSKLASIYSSEKSIKLLDEANDELAKKQGNIAKLEQVGDLLSMYRDKWVGVVNQRANDKFSSVGITFRLFDYTLDGNIVEKCDILDKGVPYEKTNTASQIKLGIKLIDALKDILKLPDLPILIDNAEAIVDKDFTTSAQLIMFSAGKEN